MKKIHKKQSPILIIALVVAVLAGYLVYVGSLEQPIASDTTAAQATTTTQTDSGYTYKTVKVNSQTFTEKYKDGQLVETVLVK